MRRLPFVLACFVWGGASAATVLLDFEAVEMPLDVKRMGGAGRTFFADITNRYATSGERAFAFSALQWKKGMNEWPGFTLKGLPTTDWREYDRLVFDVVSVGEGGDWLTVFCLGPNGDCTKGLTDSQRIPARGHFQYVVSLEKWPKFTSPADIRRIHFFSERPAVGFSVVLDRFALLKKGEPLPLPNGPCVWRDILPMVEADRDAMRCEMGGNDATRRAHMRDYFRFREACIGGKDGSAPFLLGTATAMEQVLPRGAFNARPIPAGGLGVRLARNEYESLQLVVAPLDANLADVRVKVVGDFYGKAGVFAATNIACDVVGYVETKERPPYNVGFNVATNGGAGYLRQTRPPAVGWWPDPIIGFLDGVDIRGFDVQSFWVRVHCPSAQPAGTYSGMLEVSAKGVEPMSVPLVVRVNDFTLGRVSALPLAIAYRPAVPAVLDAASAGVKRRDLEGPVNVWRCHFDEWVDFLADYLITYDDIYHFDTVASEKGQERIRALKRLKEQGRVGYFNIGHWWRNPNRNNVNSMEKWRKENIPRLRDFYETVKELGLSGNAYAYGCDEFFPKSFDSVREAAMEIKKALPDVPVFTTTFDGKLGVGSALGMVDWFCPGTASFTKNEKGVAATRKEGRKAWWYVCDGPHAPWANFFIECPAIEGRLLMGAQTVRMRPDGFLYYQISKWTSPRCIQSGPFTDWDPRSHKMYHGDGAWTCVGPDGIPVPTIRLENFRDGLEDYAYAMILERKLKEVESGKCKVNGAANGGIGAVEWMNRARELLAVPRDVMDTMTNYTDNPAVLYRWRDAMADLIEAARGDGLPGK